VKIGSNICSTSALSFHQSEWSLTVEHLRSQFDTALVKVIDFGQRLVALVEPWHLEHYAEDFVPSIVPLKVSLDVLKQVNQQTSPSFLLGRNISERIAELVLEKSMEISIDRGPADLRP
jgi:hypothetical protein